MLMDTADWIFEFQIDNAYIYDYNVSKPPTLVITLQPIVRYSRVGYKRIILHIRDWRRDFSSII